MWDAADHGVHEAWESGIDFSNAEVRGDPAKSGFCGVVGKRAWLRGLTSGERRGVGTMSGGEGCSAWAQDRCDNTAPSRLLETFIAGWHGYGIQAQDHFSSNYFLFYFWRMLSLDNRLEMKTNLSLTIHNFRGICIDDRLEEFCFIEEQKNKVEAEGSYSQVGFFWNGERM